MQLAVGFICAQPGVSSVIGGDNVDITEVPWTACLRVVNESGVSLSNRSAIILSRNYILTANHNWPAQYKSLEVHVGGTYSNTGEYRTVVRCIFHPELDMALLELSEPLNYSSRVKAVDYESAESESLYKPGTLAKISGWGTTSTDGNMATRVKAADVRVISKEEAAKQYGMYVPQNTIITVGDQKTGLAGKGDSGGPLVVWNDSLQAYSLVGVIRMADTRVNDNSGLTGSETVKPAIPWINSSMCMLAGASEVPSTGANYRISNPPPDVVSVEWSYSGVTEICSDNAHAEIISSDYANAATGYISATITTKTGKLKLIKELEIQPRIDISLEIRYNAQRSRYELAMNVANRKPSATCAWNYNGHTATDDEATFEINPKSSMMHKIYVKYTADTVEYYLDKIFSIEKDLQIPVLCQSGNLIIGFTDYADSFVASATQQVKIQYTDEHRQHSVSFDTSPVIMDDVQIPVSNELNCDIKLYSYSGKLLYSQSVRNEKVLTVNTSSYLPSIYLLNIYNYNTQATEYHKFVINE
jgi:hypothetical protein